MATKVKYPKYNGKGNVHGWVKMIETLMDAHKVQDQEKLSIAMSSLEDIALEWLYDQDASTIKDYTQLSKLLFARFAPIKKDIQHYGDMAREKIGSDETIAQFVQRMKAIASQMEEKLDEVVLTQLILTGICEEDRFSILIVDQEVQDNLELLINKAQLLEINKTKNNKQTEKAKQTKYCNYHGTCAHTTEQCRDKKLSATYAPTNQRQVQRQGFTQQRGKCWNCDKQGHRASECREPKRQHPYDTRYKGGVGNINQQQQDSRPKRIEGQIGGSEQCTFCWRWGHNINQCRSHDAWNKHNVAVVYQQQPMQYANMQGYNGMQGGGMSQRQGDHSVGMVSNAAIGGIPPIVCDPRPMVSPNTQSQQYNYNNGGGEYSQQTTNSQ